MADYINGYALALFSLAKEEKKLLKYKEEAEAVVSALKENEDIVTILNSKSIALSERQALVTKAFSKLDKNIVNFLFILVEKAKVNLATSILNKLIKFINEAQNINEGVVYTPEKITPKELEAITKKTSKELGIAKLILVNKIDKELISGFKVVVKDEIIEDTVSSRLAQIRAELLERKEN